MSWSEITVLVERAKTGDRAAYGELVTRASAMAYTAPWNRVTSSP
jgi:RNA polymerase sigma-70 factor (ECF subfamily)